MRAGFLVALYLCICCFPGNSPADIGARLRWQQSGSSSAAGRIAAATSSLNQLADLDAGFLIPDTYDRVREAYDRYTRDIREGKSTRDIDRAYAEYDAALVLARERLERVNEMLMIPLEKRAAARRANAPAMVPDAYEAAERTPRTSYFQVGRRSDFRCLRRGTGSGHALRYREVVGDRDVAYRIGADRPGRSREPGLGPVGPGVLRTCPPVGGRSNRCSGPRGTPVCRAPEQSPGRRLRGTARYRDCGKSRRAPQRSRELGARVDGTGGSRPASRRRGRDHRRLPGG